MVFDGECFIDRRGTDSVKWGRYGEGVIPLWVADMDFRSPEPVIEALRARVEHGVFGYGIEPPDLREIVVERLLRRYGWRVLPEDLVFVPGVVVGFNLAAQAVCKPGESLLLQTPIYFPMLSVAEHAGLSMDQMQLTQGEGGYGVDLDLMERTVSPTTRMFLLCNPHNPVGRAFTRAELEGMASICARHDLVICSDEIHSDFVYPGASHVPIASIDAEIANQTVTLIAPSNTYNIAGLECSALICTNADLREKIQHALRGLLCGVNALGMVAGAAAYREGD